MNTEKAKSYLKQLQKMRSEIDIIAATIIELRDKTTSPDRSQIDPNGKVKGSRDVDRRADLIAESVMLQNEHSACMKKYLILEHDVIQSIHRLKNWRYIIVLCGHYVEGKTLNRIAEDNHWVCRHVTRLHRQALQEFAEMHDFIEIEEVNDYDE